MAKTKTKRNKLLGFRIMTIDSEGNTECIYDHSTGMETPYCNEKALEKLRKKVLERVSIAANDIYNNNPSAFPDVV